MVEQNMPKRYKEALARNPTGRMATPQEIANAAVFLASPATSFTTGSNLIVDGAISNRVNFEGEVRRNLSWPGKSAKRVFALEHSPVKRKRILRERDS